MYFTTRAAGALKFSGPDHVLLRVKRPEKLRAEFKDADYYVRKAVPPDTVEFLGEDKAWHPLAKKTQEADWDPADHPREPAGSSEGGQFAAAGGGGRKKASVTTTKWGFIVTSGDTDLHASAHDDEISVDTIGDSTATQARLKKDFDAGGSRAPRPGEVLRVLRTFAQHVKDNYPNVERITTFAYHPSVEELMRRLGAEEDGEDANGKIKFVLDVDALTKVLRSKETEAFLEAWNEELHPRDEDGEFTEKGGGRPEGSKGLHGFTVERVSVEPTAGSKMNQRVMDRQSKQYGKDFQPCNMCGRHVDKTKATWLEFDNAMNVVVGDENVPGGRRHPVGPDCVKQMPENAQRWAKVIGKGPK